VEIPTAFTAFASFYQQVFVGTTLYHAFLTADSIADKGIFPCRGCFTNVDIIISVHHLLLNYFVWSIHIYHFNTSARCMTRAQPKVPQRGRFLDQQGVLTMVGNTDITP
jgi:hypothetical protein